MLARVSEEMTSLAKLRRTVLAGYRLLTSVSSHVHDQSASLNEYFRTDVAMEWLLSGVTSHVG